MVTKMVTIASYLWRHVHHHQVTSKTAPTVQPTIAFAIECPPQLGAYNYLLSIIPRVISAPFARAPSNGTGADVHSPERQSKGKGKNTVVSPDVSMEEELEEDEDEEDEDYDDDMNEVRERHLLTCPLHSTMISQCHMFQDEEEEEEDPEIDPTAIITGGRRTRGVKVDYSSKEALEKAGLKPEADDDDEEEEMER